MRELAHACKERRERKRVKLSFPSPLTLFVSFSACLFLAGRRLSFSLSLSLFLCVYLASTRENKDRAAKGWGSKRSAGSRRRTRRALAVSVCDADNNNDDDDDEDFSTSSTAPADAVAASALKQDSLAACLLRVCKRGEEKRERERLAASSCFCVSRRIPGCTQMHTHIPIKRTQRAGKSD